MSFRTGSNPKNELTVYVNGRLTRTQVESLLDHINDHFDIEVQARLERERVERESLERERLERERAESVTRIETLDNSITWKINTQQGFGEVKQYLQDNPGVVKLYLKLAEGISEIPNDFFVGLNLQELHLDNNRLTILPNSITNLSNLKQLYLFNNQLTSIPETIGNLVMLERFNLDNNQLIVLPNSIGILSNLKQFYLGDNQLINLPASMGNLRNLVWLELINNKLTVDSLPARLKQRWDNGQLTIEGMANQRTTETQPVSFLKTIGSKIKLVFNNLFERTA